MGRVHDNGSVRDYRGHELGRIDSDGKVRDENDQEIESTERISKQQAAYLHFFKNKILFK